MEALFSEELGLVLEVCESDVESVCQRYTQVGLSCYKIGTTRGFGPDSMASYFILISDCLCTNPCIIQCIKICRQSFIFHSDSNICSKI